MYTKTVTASLETLREDNDLNFHFPHSCWDDIDQDLNYLYFKVNKSVY